MEHCDLGKVQANLGTVSKYADGETRNWSLYLFFRVLSHDELNSTKNMLQTFDRAQRDPEGSYKDRVKPSLDSIILNLSNPTALTASAESLDASPDGQPDSDANERAMSDHPFRAWLRLISEGDASELARLLCANTPWATPKRSPQDIRNLIAAVPSDGPEIRAFVEENLGVDRSGPPESDGLTNVAECLKHLLLEARGNTGDLAEVHQTLRFVIAKLAERRSDHMTSELILDILKRLISEVCDQTQEDPDGCFDAFKWLLDFSRSQRRPRTQDAPSDKVLHALEILADEDGLRPEDPGCGQELDTLIASIQANPEDTLVFLHVYWAWLTLLYSSPDAVSFTLTKFGTEGPGEAGSAALRGSLPLVSFYETLREVAPRVAEYCNLGLLQPLRPQDATEKAPRSDLVDMAPINIAFSHSGLKALEIDGRTLASFPEAFREGMAARAGRLGDTGSSAPENWDGELGSRDIHGYFTGGFDVGHNSTEGEWERLREDIRLFNGRIGQRGEALRLVLGLLFKAYGMEILHVELGQDPYELEDRSKEKAAKNVPNADKFPKRLQYRHEHFGFRDGISQPFVDMGLGDPTAGGSTPYPGNSWQPVAPGEIFLGRPDSDGNIIRTPLNSDLRNGGTFLVFRKLEQDVFALRAYLRQMREDPQDQEKLAADFVGRWKNGTPLVVSPTEPGTLANDDKGMINDFLYAADDPDGLRCPLGAHIRRTNPRDIGGRNQVMRHRILRRGMAYGGRLIPHDEIADRAPRGLLFIAANARIEQQFELIQADWINGGEFLGQAGLGRCPLTGANDGTVWDAFIQTGRTTPVTHLTRFVTTRGGDYFFAPSWDAVKKMAAGDPFPPEHDAPDYRIGTATTPDLFEPMRIREYSARLLLTRKPIEIKMPPLAASSIFPRLHNPVDSEPKIAENVTFVGTHDDVSHVLKDNIDKKPENFFLSVRHYRNTAQRVSRGGLFPISTENGPVTGTVRKRLSDILNQAWDVYVRHANFYDQLNAAVDPIIDRAVRRARTVGHIDLIQDFATDAVYEIVSRCFGLRGPDWLTELAVSLPFARQHVGELHPDWLAAVSGAEHPSPSKGTMQIWTLVILADLIGNVRSQRELEALANQAGAEFLNHISATIAAAHRQRDTTALPRIDNLIDAFVHNHSKMTKKYKYSDQEYYLDVASILAEIAAATMANIPVIFGNVMNSLMTMRVDLSILVPVIAPIPPRDGRTSEGIRRLIYETDRLNPAFGLFMRYCEKELTLPHGSTIEPNRWIVANIFAANLDCNAFRSPTEFSLDPLLEGPERDENKYLLFGAANGGRHCWGREKLALAVMEKLVRGAAELNGLRRIPGPEGALQKIMRVPVGLRVRLPRTHTRS